MAGRTLSRRKRLGEAIFLPTTKDDLNSLGWNSLDIILITGDSYIDFPYIGVAVIGKVLSAAGYKVGIIGQPDIYSDRDIGRLGEPGLFWGVSGGCIDSMVANYTASGKKRKKDDYTAGGVNDKRPDRAAIAYCNLIRRYFKHTKPIVLGGIEASLRRIAHYDFWSNKIRRSILFDARADYLLYGMAERSVVGLADCLKRGKDPHHIRGLCYISGEIPANSVELPAFKEAAADKEVFSEMFLTFYRNNDPITAKPLAQQQDTRYLIQNPPAEYLSVAEMDKIYALEFERELHPFHQQQGNVKALETIRFSLNTHRGCYGECNFCAIAVHEGRTVQWRSQASILEEAKRMTKHPKFKGIIRDVGGPTANMYGFECARKWREGCCSDKRCISPAICSDLKINHGRQISLLKNLRKIDGVRKVFVSSGVRHDMVLADCQNGRKYLNELVTHHISGQMKIAPEHLVDHVLVKMGKPDGGSLLKFKELFYKLNKQAGKNQFLTYYMIAAHPGCSQKDMKKLRSFALKELRVLPEQVQIFTPTPSTCSTLMYWTEKDPFTGEPIFVEKTFKGRQTQKEVMQRKN